LLALDWSSTGTLDQVGLAGRTTAGSGQINELLRATYARLAFKMLKLASKVIFGL
jgi:hypothetical protein